MRGLRIFLFISFVANVIYVFGLVLTPKLMAEFGMAPQEVLWARYLVPIYVAISLGNWHAFRDPVRNDAMTQMLIAVWGLLIPTHLFTVGTGVESLNSAIRLGILDFLMTAGLVYFYLKREAPAQDGLALHSAARH